MILNASNYQIFDGPKQNVLFAKLFWGPKIDKVCYLYIFKSKSLIFDEQI